MFKILIGLILIVVGAMLSFIPPFIFGIPVILAAGGMIMAGVARLTGQAVKGGVTVAKHLQEKNEHAK